MRLFEEIALHHVVCFKCITAVITICRQRLPMQFSTVCMPLRREDTKSVRCPHIIKSERTDCCIKSVRSEQVMAQLEHSMSWSISKVVDSLREGFILHCIKSARSRRSWADDRLGTASKRLPSPRLSVREKLGPDKDDAANEGGLEGPVCIAFALALVFRCECEKSFHYRMTAAQGPYASSWPLYPFGPHLSLGTPTSLHSGSG
jgi:hypothetical protein